MPYHARQTFPTNGATTNFEFNFDGGYIDTSHVKAVHTDEDSIETVLTLSEEDFISEFTLQITPALSTGTLLVYRETPVDSALVDFSSGNMFTAANLDLVTKQAILAVAEVADEVQDATAPSDSLQDQIDALQIAAVNSDLNVVVVSGTTDTINASARGTTRVYTNAGAVTVTVAAIGDVTDWNINLIQKGAGQFTLDDSAVTILTSETLVSRTQGACCSLIGVGTDDWVFTGEREAA
jgi:hypothetical protein